MFRLAWVRPGQLRTVVVASDALARFFNKALLEASASHARVLTNFLFPKRRPPADVLAEHFCAPSAWDSSACPPALNTVRRRADKEVAHLTTNRMLGSDPAKAWEDGPFLVLLGELERFVTIADPAKLHANVYTEVVSARDTWDSFGTWPLPARSPEARPGQAAPERLRPPRGR